MPVTGTTSFGEAKDVCYERNLAKLTAFFEEEEWEYDDYAGRFLFPLHQFNSSATLVSLFGFLTWLFFSPHTGENAEGLDVTRTTHKKIYDQ